MKPKFRNVVFYTPSALLAAIAKFGTSANYFELRIEDIPPRSRHRAHPRLNSEILLLLGGEHSVRNTRQIRELLLEDNRTSWVIEMSLLEVLIESQLEVSELKIQGLHFGADPYLAKFTYRTFLAGISSWRECLKWRRLIEGSAMSSLLLYQSRNQIDNIGDLPIEKISYPQIKSIVLKLLSIDHIGEISAVRNLLDEFVVLGLEEEELNLNSNAWLLQEKLISLDKTKLDIVVKVHPNFQGDSDLIVGKIADLLINAGLGRILVVDKSIPLELLIYARNCLYYIGVPSSALMAYPVNKYALLNVAPSRKIIFSRSYLNAGL